MSTLCLSVFDNGITGNPAPDAGINDIGIRASEVTLGEAFQSAGYQTAIIGKWHLGHKPEFFILRLRPSNSTRANFRQG
jgi:arylsulfatase A-like enzyme